ncbi:hypothetical protein [Streptacidiphilus sp. EB129]|uniref:hypothetical protein n=1 Tax=Streptacidiphilus sp. EB129 TaxID=3156262 RepID=UPI0035187130
MPIPEAGTQHESDQTRSGRHGRHRPAPFLGPVGAAQADVGELLVTQYGSSGQALCGQDYTLLNLTGQQAIDDDVCPGAVSVDIDNLTTEPVAYQAGGSTGTVQPLGDLRIEIQGGSVVELCGLAGLGILPAGAQDRSGPGVDASCGSAGQ